MGGMKAQEKEDIDTIEKKIDGLVRLWVVVEVDRSGQDPGSSGFDITAVRAVCGDEDEATTAKYCLCGSHKAAVKEVAVSRLALAKLFDGLDQSVSS